MKKILLVMLNILIITQFFIQCQPKQDTLTMKTEKTEFKITPCHIIYKEKELPLGKPLEEWVKMFGKYSRHTDNGYVWDSLGIAVNDWEANKEYVKEIYIFFTNLDSSVGQAGKLQYAWQSYYILSKEQEESLLKSTSRNKPYTQEELDKSRKEMLKTKPEYIYPYTTYSQPIDLQGALVQPGMSLKEVNKEREKVKGLGRMGYWDNDGNWSQSEGSVTIKTGEFREQIKKDIICPDQDHWYYITLRYSEGELEYLKISYKLFEN